MEKTTGSNYKEQLNQKGTIAIVPGGNSMWPTLKHHGQAVIIRQKAERLKKYDVALFTRPDGKYVLHRVLEVLDDGYVFCGDSLLYTEKVLEEQVFGVMCGFYDKQNYVEVDDKNYIKKVEKWYRRKKLRYIRLKFFYLTNKIKRIFNRKGK